MDDLLRNVISVIMTLKLYNILCITTNPLQPVTYFICPEIGEFQVEVAVQHAVLRFNVPVVDPPSV